MGKSQLEKYYAKGWLVYGDKNISSEERLAAGIAFWEEHESCQYGTVRLPDLAQPKVDYTPKMSTPVFLLDARAKFEKAQKKLTEGQRRIIGRVCLQNKPISAVGVNFAEYNHNLELGKECLCRGLDRLVIHYGGKRTKPQLRGYSDGISLADWLKKRKDSNDICG